MTADAAGSVPEDGAAAFDAARRQLAAWLHDHPAQQLVVAGVAAQSMGVGDPLAAKVAQRVDQAGREVRDVMWVLDPPSPGEPDPAAALADLAARVGATSECAVPAGAVTDLALRCLHDLVAGAWLAGVTVPALRLGHTRGALLAVVAVGDVTPGLEPWLALARARAGDAAVDVVHGTIRVRLTD